MSFRATPAALPRFPRAPSAAALLDRALTALLWILVDRYIARIIATLEEMLRLWREGKLPPAPQRAPRQPPARSHPSARTATPRAPRIRPGAPMRAPMRLPADAPRDPAPAPRAIIPASRPAAPGPAPRPRASAPPPLRFQNAGTAPRRVTPKLLRYQN
jgi:hypothetical protein